MHVTHTDQRALAVICIYVHFKSPKELLPNLDEIHGHVFASEEDYTFSVNYVTESSNIAYILLRLYSSKVNVSQIFREFPKTWDAAFPLTPIAELNPAISTTFVDQFFSTLKRS